MHSPFVLHAQDRRTVGDDQDGEASWEWPGRKEDRRIASWSRTVTAAWMTEDWKTTEWLMAENGKAAGWPRTGKLLSDQGQERTAGGDQDGKTTGQTGGLLGMTRMENGPRMGRLLDNPVLIIGFTECSVTLTDQGQEWSVIPKLTGHYFIQCWQAKLPNSFFVLPITCGYYRCKRPVLFHSVFTS